MIIISIYYSILEIRVCICFFFFFFNDTATTEIYTLSLHDALPIFRPNEIYCHARMELVAGFCAQLYKKWNGRLAGLLDRKSTRLNSSHSQISYAVFCLKKKKNYLFHFPLCLYYFMYRVGWRLRSTI